MPEPRTGPGPGVPAEPVPAPAATYRLQLQPGFGFAEAAGTAGYLAALGVSHVYLSPILQAAPGSRHGYDVIDHSRISADLGGAAGFRAMVASFRRHGLGVIADIVPNHMAIPVPESLNRQLWSVLADGQRSPHARWFDIDWTANDGRILLPILPGSVDECIDELTVAAAGAEAVLRYGEHVLPVRPGTGHLPVRRLIEAQHYQLASWPADAARLNWRRFFDVNSLIAVRAEDPEVFAATHEVLLRLHAGGLIDGFRVDHPDGLADPAGYLEQLAGATGGAWVVAEKILTAGEELPRWRCAGTTGYDALGMVDGLFLDPAAAAPLTEEYARFTGGPLEFAGVAREAKRESARTALSAEVARLARLLAGQAALAGADPGDLRAVLAELLAAFPVYRAYLVPGQPPPGESVATIARAVAAARGNLDPRLHPVLGAVHEFVLGREPPGARASHEPGQVAGAEFAVRFQQTCGPVMAKGVEDTAFYRWSRLVSLNEVGGEPDRFGVSPEEFHSYAARLARRWPGTMTTLSTHDTKRQEDVRARLAALAEAPQAWRDAVADWHGRALELTHGQAPEPDTEYLLWQTLAGAWPIGADRLNGYLVKAMREAKTRTSWASQDGEYEAIVLGFAAAVLGDAALSASIAAFVASLSGDARANSLGAKLVQLTMPGVPDVYQGCELPGFALVDPDNRGPVDFARRRELLAAVGSPDGPGATAGPGGELPGATPADRFAAEKMLVTSRALRLRRDHPDWFAGGYAPVAAHGPAAGHAAAFLRGGRALTVATRLPAGLRHSGGWADTALPVRAGRWHDVLTGVSHQGPALSLSELTGRLPVALLVAEPPQESA